MKTHSLIPNTPQWMAYRKTMFNASDAPAMMGVSPYKTRTQLLQEMHTGITPDVDAATQSRFDEGHRFEALARPLAEAIIEMELYPVTGSEGKLSASFDGLSMCETIAFEHKTLNADLRRAMPDGLIDTPVLDRTFPAMYRIQMEQQLMVSGAERCLFMASKWDGDELVEERHAWYYPDSDLRSNIMQGWAQFEIDLDAYVPVETVIKPAANAMMALPAVSVQVSGSITIIENFRVYEVALTDFIDNRLILNPVTDQEFADLEVQIKELKKAEVALDAAEAQMLSQVESVDAAKRMKDMLKAVTSKNRIMAEKLLAAKKDTIRAEAVLGGRNDLADHIASLNTRIGKPMMPAIEHDFARAIKGLRTIESLQNAISTELARAKIEANSVADRIQVNLVKLNEKPELAFLFADVAVLALKDPEFVAMAIKNRVADHQAAEVARVEAERARIANEERIKAEAAAQSRADAEIASATQKLQEETIATNTLLQASIDHARQVDDLPVKLLDELSNVGNYLAADSIAEHAIASAQKKASAPPELKLGQICTRLGFQVTADFLKSLGFEPAGRERAAVLFHEADFPRICAALVRHINKVWQGMEA